MCVCVFVCVCAPVRMVSLERKLRLVDRPNLGCARLLPCSQKLAETSRKPKLIGFGPLDCMLFVLASLSVAAVWPRSA